VFSTKPSGFTLGRNVEVATKDMLNLAASHATGRKGVKVYRLRPRWS